MIWKYQTDGERTVINAQKDAKFLHVDYQHGILCVWAEVDDEASSEQIELSVVGTGHENPKPTAEYIGTVQHPPFVWHVYWRPVTWIT